jgi:hypothetical protein
VAGEEAFMRYSLHLAAVLAALNTTYAAHATVDGETVEVRMQILDRAGKTLAKPSIRVPLGRLASVEFGVSGWLTTVSTTVRPGPRKDCHRLQVTFSERKSYSTGAVGKRDATTTAVLCGSDAVTVGDERAHRLVLTVHPEI